jgi:hypothetical protein
MSLSSRFETGTLSLAESGFARILKQISTFFNSPEIRWPGLVMSALSGAKNASATTRGERRSAQ